MLQVGVLGVRDVAGAALAELVIDAGKEETPVAQKLPLHRSFINYGLSQLRVNTFLRLKEFLDTG